MQSKCDWLCWEVNHISVSPFFPPPYEWYSLPLSVISHNNQIKSENKFASHDRDKVKSVNECLKCTVQFGRWGWDTHNFICQILLKCVAVIIHYMHTMLHIVLCLCRLYLFKYISFQKKKIFSFCILKHEQGNKLVCLMGFATQKHQETPREKTPNFESKE